jgi:hypothetical protein
MEPQDAEMICGQVFVQCLHIRDPVQQEWVGKFVRGRTMSDQIGVNGKVKDQELVLKSSCESRFQGYMAQVSALLLEGCDRR